MGSHPLLGYQWSGSGKPKSLLSLGSEEGVTPTSHGECQSKPTKTEGLSEIKDISENVQVSIPNYLYKEYG